MASDVESLKRELEQSCSLAEAAWQTLALLLGKGNWPDSALGLLLRFIEEEGLAVDSAFLYKALDVLESRSSLDDARAQVSIVKAYYDAACINWCLGTCAGSTGACVEGARFAEAFGQIARSSSYDTSVCICAIRCLRSLITSPWGGRAVLEVRQQLTNSVSMCLWLSWLRNFRMQPQLGGATEKVLAVFSLLEDAVAVMDGRGEILEVVRILGREIFVFIASPLRAVRGAATRLIVKCNKNREVMNTFARIAFHRDCKLVILLLAVIKGAENGQVVEGVCTLLSSWLDVDSGFAQILFQLGIVPCLRRRLRLDGDLPMQASSLLKVTLMHAARAS